MGSRLFSFYLGSLLFFFAAALHTLYTGTKSFFVVRCKKRKQESSNGGGW